MCLLEMESTQNWAKPIPWPQMHRDAQLHLWALHLMSGEQMPREGKEAQEMQAQSLAEAHMAAVKSQH